jgi:hypothetical protein
MVKVFFPSAPRALSSRRTTIAPMAAEPANTSRREGVLLDQPAVSVSKASVCFRIAGFLMAAALIHSATAVAGVETQKAEMLG